MPTSPLAASVVGFSTARRASSYSCHLNHIESISLPKVASSSYLWYSKQKPQAQSATRLPVQQAVLPNCHGEYLKPANEFVVSISRSRARRNENVSFCRHWSLYPTGNRFFSTRSKFSQKIEEQHYRISKAEGKQLGNIYPEEAQPQLDDTSQLPPLNEVITKKNSITKESYSTHAETTSDILELIDELRLRINEKNANQDHIWHLYQRLPEPRALHAPDITQSFMSRLRVMKHKTPAGMMRYLSLISDLRSCGLDVPKGAWNVAISYAGRCLNKTGVKELESAIDIWREMEQTAKVQSTIVTFNMLFDVAMKASKFAFAESVLREMRVRGFEHNRHFRTAMIYYKGLREDGGGVRKAYNDLIEAGEIVDTAVINCVIAALLKCREPGAAEFFFESAKQLHASKVEGQLPPPHWYAKRQLGQKLDQAAQKHRDFHMTAQNAELEEGSEMAEVKQMTSIAPDATTYRLLIHHYAVEAGDIERAAQLIDEMGEYNIPVEGNVFLWLFFAFAAHGGKPYSQWTRRRLENTWVAFLNSIDERQASKGDAHDSRQFFDADENVRRWSQQDRVSPSDQHGGTRVVRSDQDDGPLIWHNENTIGEEQQTLEEAEEDLSKFAPLEEVPPIFKDGLYIGFAEDFSSRGVYIGKVMALQIGRAFAKCSHMRRTVEIWMEVKKRWKPEVASDVSEVESMIAASFPTSHDFFLELVTEEDHQWGSGP